jgi:hypothetical protein
MIKDFLKKNELEILEKDRYLVIGGTFGIGKTTLVKVKASRYAQNYLSGNEDSFSYIPVPIFLKHGMTTEYNGRSLDYVITNIVANDNEAKKNNEMLLFLDGLDEYNKSSIAEVVNRYVEAGYKLKVIITTRLDDNLIERNLPSIKFERYIRLLPFSEQQIDDFFKKYGVKIDENKYLTCRYARELDLPVEIMAKPLFAWMFSLVQLNGDTKSRLERKTHWSPNMKKSWIYFQFFYNIIQARQKRKHKGDSWKRWYSIEKKGLRIIAALKQMYTQIYQQQELSLEKIEGKIQSFEVNNSTTAFDLEEIARSYFLHVRDRGSTRLVNFVHKSFMEYLVAEYYLENLLNQGINDEDTKLHRLNIGIPSNTH